MQHQIISAGADEIFGHEKHHIHPTGHLRLPVCAGNSILTDQHVIEISSAGGFAGDEKPGRLAARCQSGGNLDAGF